MATDRKFNINDLKSLLPVIKKRKWWVIIPWIVVSAVVAAGSFQLTPVYEAFTIISIDTDVKLSTELQHLLGIQRAYRRPAQSERLRGIYNEITSSQYVKALNQELKLDENPGFQTYAQTVASTSPDMNLEQVTIMLLQNKLKGQVEVSSAATDQIRIRVESPNPTEASDIANALADTYIIQKHQQEMASIRSSQNFSDIQLQKYEKQLDDKVREKTRFEQQFLTVQLDESITSESNRSEITAEIDRTNNEINDQREEERRILGSLVKVSDISTNNLALVDSENNIETKAELKRELRNISHLMIRYPWNDPQVLNSKVKQNTLIASLESENKQLVNRQYTRYETDTRALLTRLFNVRSNLEYMYQKDSYLRSALTELTDKMNLIPQYQATLNRLDQEIETTTELRDRFKRQQESSTINQALLQDASASRFNVIEPARVPIVPFKPDKMKLVVMGFLLGLIIGGVAATIVELMDSSFKRVDDVEDQLNLPVLGVVPKIDFLKKIAG